MTARPIRLQLSRKKGFNLQEHSKATNGLDAVNCARPSKWGNRHKIDEDCNATVCVALYHFDLQLDKPDASELTGQNLACWCGLNDPCHVDPLLKYANPEVSQ